MQDPLCEEMVRKDLVGPSPYPVYILQIISNLPDHVSFNRILSPCDISLSSFVILVSMWSRASPCSICIPQRNECYILLKLLSNGLGTDTVDKIDCLGRTWDAWIMHIVIW